MRLVNMRNYGVRKAEVKAWITQRQYSVLWKMRYRLLSESLLSFSEVTVSREEISMMHTE